MRENNLLIDFLGLAGASEKEFDQARDMLEDALLRDETLDIPLTAVKVVDGAMAVKVKFKGIDFDLIPTPTFSQSKKEQVGSVSKLKTSRADFSIL